MINSNEILEMLKSGKSVDEIASEYSKALNEAIKAKEQKNYLNCRVVITAQIIC